MGNPDVFFFGGVGGGGGGGGGGGCLPSILKVFLSSFEYYNLLISSLEILYTKHFLPPIWHFYIIKKTWLKSARQCMVYLRNMKNSS